MNPEQNRGGGDCDRPAGIEHLMWIASDRMLYVGLLGQPTTRNAGAITVYVALEAPLRLSMGDGPWQAGRVAMVQPYARHRVASDARHIALIHVEPETVDPQGLPPLLRGPSGVVEADDFRARVLDCHRMLARNDRRAAEPMPDFDALLFGEQLAPRRLDPRIERVLAHIRAQPAAQLLAQDCAELAHLSFSRFLHLFKHEVGTPFRNFRSWQRARGVLRHVADQRSTLTEVALGAGYPDATHFSHCIRQVYGLKPKDIFAGSRRLRVIGLERPLAA